MFITVMSNISYKPTSNRHIKTDRTVTGLLVTIRQTVPVQVGGSRPEYAANWNRLHAISQKSGYERLTTSPQ